MIATTEYSTPQIYNQKVQELNTALDALGWIEKIYPIAYKGEEEEGTFPEVYYNDGSKKNIRVLPGGKAISFFQIESDLVEVDEFFFNTQLSLTVWADLAKIDSGKKYDFTTELIKEVLNVLRLNSCYDFAISTDEVLSGFSYMEKKLSQNTMRPYTAFKITFNTLLSICWE